MYLTSLSLLNFKNILQLELDLSSRVNCFLGDNGQGKTNLLDAIYHLSYTKSYFNSIDSQNIMFDESFYVIQGQVSDDSEEWINENANSNGVLFIPAFTGLGAPYWNSDIRASFHGITRDTNKNDLTTAAFNSIAYQTLDIVNLLKGMNVDAASLDLDGGMVANQTFVTNLCKRFKCSAIFVC